MRQPKPGCSRTEKARRSRLCLPVLLDVQVTHHDCQVSEPFPELRGNRPEPVGRTRAAVHSLSLGGKATLGENFQGRPSLPGYVLLLSLGQCT